MATWFGANAPFIGGNQNVLSLQTDEKLVRNDLLQLLLTAPGERIYRPTFGTDIRKFLFEQITDDSIDQLKRNIAAAILKWEPRVTVSSIVVATDPDNNTINIKIYGVYNFNKISGSSLLIEFNLNTFGGNNG